MTHHTDWLTSADAQQFQQFLDSTLKGLRPERVDELPDGVGDAEGSTAMFNYAIARTENFAAFQWFTSETEHPVRWELFFAAPKTGAARIGLRASHRSPSPPPIPTWLARLLGPVDTAPLLKPLPGFMELAALLCSRTTPTSMTAAAHQMLSAQNHELEYIRQLSKGLADELRQVNSKLRDVVSARASTAAGEPVGEPAAMPLADLSELRMWAVSNEERIIVLPRALNAAKKSIYESPETVFVALELLAGPYRDLRRSKIEYAQFAEALAASEMPFEGSVGSGVAGKQGDAYFATWEGQKRFMDLHLRKGGGRDERYCLRIYFFWDDQIQKVVVGWLPSHLPNSLS